MTAPPTAPTRGSFVPPAYPFDKLTELVELASLLPSGAVDLSVGTPCDPPPRPVVEALSKSAAERGYPPSIGSLELREAAASFLARRFAVEVPVGAIAACVGSKELVAGVPGWLRLRTPGKDTVLCPELAYPTYEMGASLSGCRAVAVPAGPDGRLDLAAVAPEDAGRALCLWVNSPANPAGHLEDLRAAASWGRARSIPVFSDECYAEFTWSGDPSSVLESGLDGVVAVHSLSKRSNLAGLRVGFFAGDPELVAYLGAVRRHAGLIVPGPVQHAAAVALADDEHVAAQREIYRERLSYLASALEAAGVPVRLPEGAFYLWVVAPAVFVADGGGSPGYELAKWLARVGGAITSPGRAYGPAGRSCIRIALVQPMDRLGLVAERLGSVQPGRFATR